MKGVWLSYWARFKDVKFLVLQRLRIHLAMQGTRVQSLIQEDSTCCRATKPLYHHHWARALPLLSFMCLQPGLHKREATAIRSLCTAMKSSPCSPWLKKAHMQQWRPSTAKNKELRINRKKKKPTQSNFKNGRGAEQIFFQRRKTYKMVNRYLKMCSA